MEPDAPSPWRDVFAAFRYRHFALGALAIFVARLFFFRRDHVEG